MKVFILAGQSNLEGKAAASTLLRSLAIAATQERFAHLRKDGEWVVRDDVFVAYPYRAKKKVATP